MGVVQVDEVVSHHSTESWIFKVGKVISGADGGCSSCVGGLVRRFIKEFPGVDYEELFAGVLAGDQYFAITPEEKEEYLKRYRERAIEINSKRGSHDEDE